MNDYPPESETLHGAAVRLKAALKAAFEPPTMALVIGAINVVTRLIRGVSWIIDQANTRHDHPKE